MDIVILQALYITMVIQTILIVAVLSFASGMIFMGILTTLDK